MSWQPHFSTSKPFELPSNRQPDPSTRTRRKRDVVNKNVFRGVGGKPLFFKPGLPEVFQIPELVEGIAKYLDHTSRMNLSLVSKEFRKPSTFQAIFANSINTIADYIIKNLALGAKKTVDLVS